MQTQRDSSSDDNVIVIGAFVIALLLGVVAAALS